MASGTLTSCGDAVSTSAETGQCITFLTFRGERYWGTLGHNVPVGRTLGHGNLPDCDEHQRRDAPAPRGSSTHEVHEIRHIDATVAVAEQEGNGVVYVWIAFDDNPDLNRVHGPLRQLIH